MQKISFLNIFKAFFKIGLILLGGGYVMVPIMKQELLEKRGWLTEDEIYDFYCVSQCLCGIIAINMAVLTGYKLLKMKGVFAAISGMCFSPVVSIIIIANIMNKITNIPFIGGVFWGINICIIILIYLTLKEIWKKSIVDIFTFFWFFLILILSLIKVSPVILIVCSIFLGLILRMIRNKKDA